MITFYRETTHNSIVKIYSEILFQKSVVKFHEGFGAKSLASIRKYDNDALLNIIGGF